MTTARSIPLPLYGLELGGAPIVLRPAGAVPIFERRNSASSFSQACSGGRALAAEIRSGEDLAIHLRKAQDLAGRIVIWNPQSLNEKFTCEDLRELLSVLPPITRVGMDHRRVEFPVYLLVGRDEISPHVLSGDKGKAVILYESEEESAAIAHGIGWPSVNGIGINSATNLKSYFGAVTRLLAPSAPATLARWRSHSAMEGNLSRISDSKCASIRRSGYASA
jgi:hypothetical protein